MLSIMMTKKVCDSVNTRPKTVAAQGFRANRSGPIFPLGLDRVCLRNRKGPLRGLGSPQRPMCPLTWGFVNFYGKPIDMPRRFC